MTWETTLALTLAAAVFAASPGPGVLAAVSRALAAGFRPAAALSLGMVLGDFVYLFAALIGWAAIAPLFGDVFAVVRIASAGYLIWLGIRAWRRDPAVDDGSSSLVHQRRPDAGPAPDRVWTWAWAF